MEATGGYETLLVAALHTGGLPVVLINPRWARAFAKAIGQLAKTDRIDARVLVLYAERAELEPTLARILRHSAARSIGPTPWHTVQQFVFVAPQLRATHRSIDITVELLEPLAPPPKRGSSNLLPGFGQSPVVGLF